jgi:hypothetical protein
MAVQVAQVLTNPLSVRAYVTASTSSTLHLTSEGWYKSGALGASTLCGSPVYRLMPEFRPSEATRAYVERRTKEGLSKREIIRCLKRYVAREVYRHLRDGA